MPGKKVKILKLFFRDLDQLKDAVRKDAKNYQDAQNLKITSLEAELATLKGKMNILEANVTSKKKEKEPVPPLCTVSLF